jgi:hypothetical protein
LKRISPTWTLRSQVSLANFPACERRIFGTSQKPAAA